MADPTGLSTVLAGKVLDATIGYVQTANRYNARHKDLEDLVHTMGAFLQAFPSDVAPPIVQRVFQDVQPLHKGAQKLVRKRQDWEDKTTAFDRHLRLHTRWKLSKDALDHTQKIRTTEADRLPRAILMSVLDLQKELKSLRKDVRDIKSSLGHPGACKQETISQEKEILKQKKRKQKRRKPKRSKQEKDSEAAGKVMDTTRADCITNFALGVRIIQERLSEAIIEGGHDAYFDVIEGAMRQVVDLHLESIRSAQIIRPCPSSTATSESWDSTITVNNFCQIQDGRDLKNADLPQNIEETEHMEVEEIELANDVVGRIEQLHGPTGSQYIRREIPYGTAGNFTFKVLKTATDNFGVHNLLGTGGSASVYRGCLPDGSKIAVKRMKAGSRVEELFWREVQCSFEHPAIVKMLGWCAPEKSRRHRSFRFKKKNEKWPLDGSLERYIVMEYLEGGSLYDQLFGNNGQDLDWPVRLKICICASGGISVIHKQGIVHSDIKPGNILLDNNFSPKICDFGISKLLPGGTPDVDGVSTSCLRGTIGYIDPEYHSSFRVGPKSDVYSFGTTMLNVVSGSQAIDFNRKGDEALFLHHAKTLLKGNRFKELIDPKIKMTIEDVTEVSEVLRIAMLCSEPQSKDRPTMDEVHSMLLEVGSRYC